MDSNHSYKLILKFYSEIRKTKKNKVWWDRLQNYVLKISIFLSRFDCDSEGMICVEELKFIMSNLPVKVSSQEIEEMVSAADLDGDGKINFQEFRKMIGQ